MECVMVAVLCNLIQNILLGAPDNPMWFCEAVISNKNVIPLGPVQSFQPNKADSQTLLKRDNIAMTS